RCVFGGNGARHPCLLALFRDVEDDAPAGIHRIGLTPDGNKIERLTLGRWAKPRAIKLWSATNRLTIGEGLETVLGAICCGAVTPPAWAIGGRTGIAEFPVLPDADHPGGQRRRPGAPRCRSVRCALRCCRLPGADAVHHARQGLQRCDDEGNDMKVTHIDHGDWTEERWEPEPPDDPTTGNGKAIGDTPGDTPSITPSIAGAGAGADAWPVLDKAAYHGLAGDVVNTIAPHTE